MFAQAIFNSLIIDWILRFSVAINVNKTYIMRLPIPQPDDNEIENNPLYKEIAINSLLLSCYYNSKGFAPLLSIFGLQKKDIPDSEKKSLFLRAKNDALIAHIYGITKDEMKHILKGFPLFTNKNQAYLIMLLNLI